MNVIAEPRQCGKTTKIFKWLREMSGRAVIVMHEEARKIYLREGFSHDEVYTLSDFRRLGVHGRNVREVMIDDIETILYKTFPGVPIVGFTCTTYDQPQIHYVDSAVLRRVRPLEETWEK